MVLAILYNGSITKLNQTGKAVHIMTQQFRYVAGHIEVYSEYGEFLFSADTMQEAREELSAKCVQMQLKNIQHAEIV